MGRLLNPARAGGLAGPTTLPRRTSTQGARRPAFIVTSSEICCSPRHRVQHFRPLLFLSCRIVHADVAREHTSGTSPPYQRWQHRELGVLLLLRNRRLIDHRYKIRLINHNTVSVPVLPVIVHNAICIVPGTLYTHASMYIYSVSTNHKSRSGII